MPNGPFANSGAVVNNHRAISGAQNIRIGSNVRDTKAGLGYGILAPKTQFPRQMSPEFPYIDKKDSTDEEYDEESTDAVSKKYQSYVPSDFLSAAGANPFYFVGGNTKLADCFWRTNSVLQEIATFSDSMSPMPQIYNNGNAVLGAGASFPYQGGGGSSYKRTGSLQGWSKSPPESYLQAEERAEEDESEEIFTLKDLADKILQRSGENIKRQHI